MSSEQVRRQFLDYFRSKGHQEVGSASLVPLNDPTLLFTNAGMNQFKDVFTGQAQLSYLRATSAQKCVRAGGKHNDLGERRPHRAAPHLLRDAGEFLLRRLLQAGRHRLRARAADQGLRHRRGQADLHRPSLGRRGAPAVEEDRRRGRRPRHRARRQGQLLGHGRDRTLRPVQRDPFLSRGPTSPAPRRRRAGRVRARPATAIAGWRSGTWSSCSSSSWGPVKDGPYRSPPWIPGWASSACAPCCRACGRTTRPTCCGRSSIGPRRCQASASVRPTIKACRCRCGPSPITPARPRS